MLGPCARGNETGADRISGRNSCRGGPMTPAIIYARYSPRPNAGESMSIETQLDRCRAYCKGNDYPVTAEYKEPNVSGDALRPELQKAIQHSQRLRAVLVVSKLDRAARDTED